VAEVIDGPQSIVFPQAANRLPTAQAILYALITDQLQGEAVHADDPIAVGAL
jgi:ornithine carbamoyltransferase